MKATGEKRYLKIAMAGLPAVAITFGLASGSVLAAEVSEEDYKLIQSHKKKEAEKQLPPHQRPAPAHPASPSGPQEGNLAEAATNPIANLIQFQVQDVLNFENHNSDGYSNDVIIQPVAPVKLPVKLFFEVLNNPEDNAGPTAEWTAKFNMTMLFPE
jgi:hypothetical protein